MSLPILLRILCLPPFRLPSSELRSFSQAAANCNLPVPSSVSRIPPMGNHLTLYSLSSEQYATRRLCCELVHCGGKCKKYTKMCLFLFIFYSVYLHAMGYPRNSLASFFYIRSFCSFFFPNADCPNFILARLPSGFYGRKFNLFVFHV
jgi:hypothetical protein